MAAQVSQNATDPRFSIDQSIISFLAFQRHHAYRELGHLDSASEAGRQSQTMTMKLARDSRILILRGIARIREGFRPLFNDQAVRITNGLVGSAWLGQLTSHQEQTG
jgi:hypothetical protein